MKHRKFQTHHQILHRIKGTFGYKKRFQSSAFVQDKLSTLIGQLIENYGYKKLSSYHPGGSFYPSLTVLVSFLVEKNSRQNM